MSRTVKVNNTKLAATTHGRKYAYSFQNMPLKIFGKRSLGLDSVPPIRGLHDQIQHAMRWRIDKYGTLGLRLWPIRRAGEQSLRYDWSNLSTRPWRSSSHLPEKGLFQTCTHMGILVTYRYCHSKDRKGTDFSNIESVCDELFPKSSRARQSS